MFEMNKWSQQWDFHLSGVRQGDERGVGRTDKKEKPPYVVLSLWFNVDAQQKNLEMFLFKSNSVCSSQCVWGLDESCSS